MSLLTTPEGSSSSRERLLVIILALVVVIGVGFFVLTRSPSNLESADTSAALAPAVPEADRNEPPVPTTDPALAPVVDALPPVISLPTEPRLSVVSDVVGADVFIDRQYAGKTPFESFDVALGPHRINVSAPGYEGFSRDVTVRDIVTRLDATFKVLKLHARVAVVHKHRFGDCEGELAADLDGIHYRTDDDDAFFTGFQGLDDFSVDYLKHNLRLKVRDGRVYNFTDREVNADKLFLFHREVERTLERLLASEP